jgi:hypothetical protein
MSNPTTPFGWQMPTATDLVTDLPADFEVFGQAVATSMADLLGGTTGQILAKNSATDMDFVWIANDQGDITGITATSPLTGGGTSGAITVGIQAASTTQSGAVQLSDSTSTTSSVLASTPTATKSAYDLADAAIAKSTVTTAGDIIYRNATVPVRLGIGTANQVLRVNSGATAPEWATPTTGGLVFLTGTSFSAVSSVSLPNNTFTSTYTNYKIIFNLTAAAGAITETRFRLRAAGADNTSANYSNGGYEINSAGGGSASSGQTQTSVLWGNIATSTPQFTQFEMTMFSPQATSYTTFNVNGSKGTATWKAMTGFYEATTSFDAMTFYPDAGTITGSYRVYGIANS